MRFDQQLVVVTGGGRGIGFALARAFRAEGATVVIAEIDASRGRDAAQSLGAHFLHTDVSDHQSVRQAVDAIIADHGRIDVWINNAGVAHKSPVVDLDVDGWEADIGVMLSGTFYCAKYAGQVLIKQGSGCMVNVSSVNGLLAQKARAGYCAAKAGINMLTKVLASEWGEHGIRVNAVAPGVVMTDLVEEGINQGIVTEEQYLGRIPMGELGELNDVVEAVLFLASDEASFVTGEVLRVDGGWTAYHLFYPFDEAF